MIAQNKRFVKSMARFFHVIKSKSAPRPRHAFMTKSSRYGPTSASSAEPSRIYLTVLVLAPNTPPPT